jgi:phosphatidate cytidylyltransferase
VSDGFELKVLTAGLVLYGLAALVALVATLVVRDRHKVRRLWATWLAKLGPIVVVVGPALLGTWALAAALLVIALLASREVQRAAVLTGLRPIVPLGLTATAALVLAAALWGPPGLYGAFAVALVASVAAARGSRPTALGTALPIVYPGLLLAHALLVAERPGGIGWLLFVYALIEVNDGFAFMFGLGFGRHKIWPRLSPGKTYEGSLGGLAATVAAAVPIGFAVPHVRWPGLVVAGLLVGVAGQAGDLVASAIKRRAGIKDFGTLVPTRGGVMDVYDALTFTSPLLYLGLVVTGL